MNRKVQAVDPSRGVWLLGKVCGETEGNDGTFHVKWQDYKEKTHVMKYKTRQPEPKRKFSVKDKHWPHFKHPSKLQQGNIVQLIGTETLENLLNVEENDPFRGEVSFLITAVKKLMKPNPIFFNIATLMCNNCHVCIACAFTPISPHMLHASSAGQAQPA